jgi:glycolate oxidase iron-sulfur subunit
MSAPQGPGRPATPLDPTGELRAVASDCVHCGFCLPACPTYQLWGEEMDSPRGRIHLMTQILDGTEGTQAAADHLDRCLGCMACVTACPSGVRYDRLIEAARGWTEDPPAGAVAARGPAAQNGPGPRSAPGPAAQNGPGPRSDEEPPRAERLPAQPPLAGPPPHPGPSRPLPERPLRDRAVRAAIFSVFPYPRRLRAALLPLRAAQRTRLDALLDRSGLAGRLSPELAAALRVAPGPPPARGLLRRPPARPAARPPRLPERVPARGARRAVVGMLTGCVQQVFFPQVNAATARVLAAEGCDVVIPAGQGCCGALSWHGGRRAEAARFARQTVETFERAGVDAVVVNSAGCGSAMKEYADLLADDPGWSQRAAALAGQVRDLSEFLADLGPVAPRHPLPLTAAYHDACHLAHAQRITAQPRSLLAAIPGLRLADIADGAICCGSAGIYNLVQPEAARELGQRKAQNVAAAGADLLVSGNPGCAMQIASALAARGARLPMAHTAEVLDASLRGAPATTLLT